MGGMSTRNEIKARLGILAEPLAMARMGRWTLEDAAGWGDMSKQWTATINGTQWAIVVDGATGTGSLMRMQPGRAPQTVQRGPVEQLKRYAESLRASRPGAKAKMDKNADYVEYANLRETLSKLENRLRRAPVEERARLQRELDAGIKRSRELADRLRSARLGAKAKMDLTDVQRKAGYKWRVAYTRQLGKDQYLGGPPVTLQDDLLFATEGAARQWADAMLKKGWFKGHGGGPEKILKATVLMASRPGAKSTHEAPAQKPGRKVMAESDPAVSAKIRKLMAEGKPQEQAVAIALDMKRRGEI
jgi:ribosomal protein S18